MSLNASIVSCGYVDDAAEYPYTQFMCGIVGIWNRRSGVAVDPALLGAMRETLNHRGPDDAGLFLQDSIGLGHRRLAILDLSPNGHQPMTTPDGRFTIIFNGEIYNYRELREHLPDPKRLVSSSDTEILLHLLANHGEDALPLLRGMFAFALWDRTREELTLVRDAFGKKPLYYADRDGVFLFASEPKALLVHPAISREIDPVSLPKYFLYEYVPAPATMYRDIRQIPMGHVLRVTKAGSTLGAWWTPRFSPKRTDITEAEAVSELDRMLDTAVQRRMVADVPVGILLSGGVDSTTIAWYMRRHTRGPLHSFSVTFSERSFDESAAAQFAARAMDTTHHELPFTVATFHDTLRSLLPLMDEPFADASLLPTYAVSRFARPTITVGLDGDGSDELFGGYGTFSAALLAERLPRLSPALANVLLQAVSLLPTKYENFSFDFKAKSFVRGLSYPTAVRNQIWLGSFTDAELPQLLTERFRPALSTLFADIDDHAMELKGLSLFDAVSLLTIRHYLTNDILLKLDRATMAVALETRTPFLDLDLATFTLRLPEHLKRGKRLLKSLMNGRIPGAILRRPKKGFGIPLGQWLRGPLRPFAETTLARQKILADGILNPDEVAHLLKEHMSGRADHRKKIWTLLAFQCWYDQWIARRA